MKKSTNIQDRTSGIKPRTSDIDFRMQLGYKLLQEITAFAESSNARLKSVVEFGLQSPECNGGRLKSDV